MADTFESLRSRMVAGQLLTRGIEDKNVLRAFQTIERHFFVPKNLEHCAYDDSPIPIPSGQTISQPYIIAFMIEAAQIDRSSNILEIGTGSGYQTAILSEICKEVYTIEISKELADISSSLLKYFSQKIHTKHGDGADGWEEAGPFDAIIVSACHNQIPEKLIQQIKIGGRIIMPIEDEYGNCSIFRATKQKNNKFIYEELMEVGFMRMLGKEDV